MSSPTIKCSNWVCDGEPVHFSYTSGPNGEQSKVWAFCNHCVEMYTLEPGTVMNRISQDEYLILRVHTL